MFCQLSPKNDALSRGNLLMLKYSGAILVEVLEGSSNPDTENQAFF